MNRISLLLVSCIAIGNLWAGEIAMSAKIVGTGITEGGHPGCIVEAKVWNRGTLPVPVAMMTCSWNDCWCVTPRRDFSIQMWACDSNFATEYSFPPGGGFLFRFCLEATSASARIDGQKVRIGFYLAQGDRLSRIRFFDSETVKRLPIVWSEEITIPGVGDNSLKSIAERILMPNHSPEPAPGAVH